MIHVCFYFQVHQPNRLRKYTYFDVGRSHFYEDEDKNRDIMTRVARKCYLPANKVLLDLIDEHKERFKVSFSITGTVVEQMKKFCPEVLDSFKKLADTGCVEFLNETYNHSLAFVYSQSEFKRQVELHKKMVKEEFGQRPKTFRNTELIYNNDLAALVEKMGFKTILAEGADRLLGWRSPHFVYQPEPCTKLKLMLKSYRLSDDIAFRFSNRDWPEFPLTAEKFAGWVHGVEGGGETVNLFMDYETFGEHQWAETGIFEFLRALPGQILKHPEFKFSTPSEVSAQSFPVAKLDARHFVSWADEGRDLTAWRGNQMQEDSLEAVFALEEKVMKKRKKDITKVWRSLHTSDHFYYMSTKWFNDGDVHKYFNPYDSPYEAYINYQNVLADLEYTLNQ